MGKTIRGVLFDKDGTLFDFHASWSGWAMRLLHELAGGDAVRARALGELIAFDTAKGRFRPDSPVIAGTPEEAAQLLSPGLPEMTLAALAARIDAAAAEVDLVEAAPLAPLLARLRDSGLALGIATNDAEAVARAHAARAGVATAFDHIFGFDSGHGPKPGPGMCLAFANAAGLAPGEVLMVGDSTHDLQAGRAAGMGTVGVLTGPAGAEELAPLADHVLDHIGGLPELIAGLRGTGTAGVAGVGR